MQIDRPFQCVVSDMTAFYVKDVYDELTLYVDLWNDEILAHALSSKRGDRMAYLSGLDDLIELKSQYLQYEMILHSDQGAVYASKAFNELLPMYTNRQCCDGIHQRLGQSRNLHGFPCHGRKSR